MSMIVPRAQAVPALSAPPPVVGAPCADLVHWRTWLSLLLQAMAAGLAISLVLSALVVLSASTANAQTTELPEPLKQLPRGAGIGDGAALMFQTTAGWVAAPLQSTRVQLKVTGHTVRAQVSQTYRNPSAQWLDGSYRFPLPDDSAVDSLRMRIGDRLIKGVIQERKQAAKNFERARKQGKRASLVSQTKPNDFTARVANIGPHSEITIEIEYQQVMAISPLGWSLRFPTVVAPRYVSDQTLPGSPPDATRLDADKVQTVSHEAKQSAEQPEQAAPIISSRPAPTWSNEALRDAARANTTPTLIGPDTRQNRIRIDVTVDAGIPVSVPRSLTHAIVVSNESIAPVSSGSERYQVSFVADELADRDFELLWAPLAGAAPTASVQFEQFQGDWYGLLVVSPPEPSKSGSVKQAREVIFVIDTSGSMHGESIDQARTALQFGLQRLMPTDRFNIIQFNNKHELLFRSSRTANQENLQDARHYLRNLRADGGTEMGGALEAALAPGIPAGFISQVVFVTDGSVGNESALFNTIESLLGNRRLFTVGIGSAPNGFFMRQAAAAGRGTFSMIGKTNQVEQRMAALFEQLAMPMLTNVKLRSVTGELIDTGLPVRDLYAGEPVIHHFQLKKRPEAIFIEGDRAGTPWQQEIRVSNAADSGVHRLWAKTAIEELSARIRRPGLMATQRDRLRNDATLLALNHHLVSDYTSLVAIDATPARPASETSREGVVPRHLPRGWDLAKVTGQQSGTLAQGSNGLLWQLLTGSLLLLLAVLFAAAFLTRAEKLLVRDN